MSQQAGWIELTVVVGVLTILVVASVYALHNFSVVAKNQRRIADIQSLAKALEVNKKNNGYISLDSSFFNDNIIPEIGPARDAYCIFVPKKFSFPHETWITSSCPKDSVPVSNQTPPEGAKSYLLCASLEPDSNSPAAPYCVASSQQF